MILHAFVVRDEKVDAYAHPFFAPTAGLAIRMFSDWCSEEGSIIAKHPVDYRLYRVGTWDDVSGILGSETPVLISSGGEVVDSDLRRRAGGGV